MAKYKTYKIFGGLLEVKMRTRGRIEAPQGVKNAAWHYRRNPGKLFWILVLVVAVADPRFIYEGHMMTLGRVLTEHIFAVLLVFIIYFAVIKPLLDKTEG